jgi:hypothetical protein
MEQLNYNLLFRWFVGLSPDDPVWDATTFTKNRNRLQRGNVFGKFMERLLDHPRVKPLLSDEHFSVDGTLIEAWASHKSFQPKDGSDDGDGSNFHGQRRKNDTHQSTSDPQAKLYRKGTAERRAFIFLVVKNVSLDGSCKTVVGIRSRDIIRLPLLGIRISHGNRSADLAEHREIILHIAQRRDRHGWNNEPSEEGVDEGSFIKVGRVISR